MKMRNVIMAALFGAVVAISAPAPALGIEKQLYDNPTIVYRAFDRDQLLSQFKQDGGDSVRIDLVHFRGTEPVADVYGTLSGGGPWGLINNSSMDDYDSAVDAVSAYGLKVQINLQWYGMSDPGALANWIVGYTKPDGTQVPGIVQHFTDRANPDSPSYKEGAGTVYRYTILNEPDLSLFGVDDCDPQEVTQMVNEGTLKTVRARVPVYKRLTKKQLRAYRGVKYRRARRRISKDRYDVYYVRLTKKQLRTYTRPKYLRRKIWKNVVVTGVSSKEQETVSIATGCLKVKLARRYAQIVHEVAPAIHAAAPPGTEVAAGDTSPCTGTLLFTTTATQLIIDAANQEGKPLPIVVWLTHPYLDQEGNIYNGSAIAVAAHGIPVGYDEFGVWDDNSNKFGALISAWRQAPLNGATVMNQYGFNAPLNSWWQTSLHGDYNMLKLIMQSAS
jgi:hypothetical protein